MIQNRYEKLVCVFGLMAALVAFCGCEPVNSKVEKPADPPSFKGSVTKLVEMRNKIRDGFAVGNVDMAHGPLHEVGHVLEKIGEIAAIEHLPADQLEAVKAAKEELFDAFDQVDRTLHGKEGKSYDEVAESVDRAMKVLTDIAGVEDESAAADDGAMAGDDLPSGEGEVVEESVAEEVVEEVQESEGSGNLSS